MPRGYADNQIDLGAPFRSITRVQQYFKDSHVLSAWLVRFYKINTEEKFGNRKFIHIIFAQLFRAFLKLVNCTQLTLVVRKGFKFFPKLWNQ